MEVSQSELARRLNVSRSAVAAWIKRGMPLGDNGRVDLRSALEWVAENCTHNRQRRVAAKARELLAERFGGEGAEIDVAGYDVDGETAIEVVRQILAAAGHQAGPVVGLDEAQLAKEIVAAATGEMRRRQARGELIERRKAEAAAFSWARRIRDAWLTWPARVSGELAGRLGAPVQEVEAALDEAVRGHLREIGDGTVGFAS